MFLFYLGIVNKMRQVSITVSEFTHSNKQPCGRRDIEFIWQFTALSFQILLNLHWKMWKTVALACKLLKSLCKRPWGSSKEILLIYYFSMPDEGGENRIYQFLSFSVYFWKFWLRQGGLSFYGSQKRDEGADTDLMFQFCLPYHSFYSLLLTKSLCAIKLRHGYQPHMTWVNNPKLSLTKE